MAKKKYYQGARDRMDEGRGMKDRYAGNGLIADDASQPCYLPDRIIDKDIPKNVGYRSVGYKDLYSGVERSMAQDRREMQKVSSKDPEFY